MKDVVFVFGNQSNEKRDELFYVHKSIGKKTSIRKMSIEAANEAIKQGGVEYWKDKVVNSDAIALYLSSPGIKNASDAWKKSGFGIKYALNKDGSIQILSGYTPLHCDWTLDDIEEMVRYQYLEWDGSTIIVELPVGLGAGPQDLFDWLGFVANMLQILGATTLGERSIKTYIKYKVRDRKIKKITHQWVRNNIQYPEQIRSFIDVKAGWELSEIKKRLKLDDEFAIQLLNSLGYEPKGDIWRLTHSKKSIANRKRWLRGEKKYRRELT